MARTKRKRTWQEPYGARLAAIREGQRMTQQQLAETMTKAGLPLSRETVSQIESGRRPMKVAEMVAFTYALDVWPGAIFIDPDAETLQLTPEIVVAAPKAIPWATGLAPLNPRNRRTYLFQLPVSAQGGAAMTMGGGGTAEVTRG